MHWKLCRLVCSKVKMANVMLSYIQKKSNNKEVDSSDDELDLSMAKRMWLHRSKNEKGYVLKKVQCQWWLHNIFQKDLTSVGYSSLLPRNWVLWAVEIVFKCLAFCTFHLVSSMAMIKLCKHLCYWFIFNQIIVKTCKLKQICWYASHLDVCANQSVHISEKIYQMHFPQPFLH